jgi:hypothetical protein
VDTEHTPAGHYARFFTRYGSLYWANDIKPLENTESVMSISGKHSDALWWKGFSNQRTVGNTQWMIFSLVVPPHHPRVMMNPACLMPAPAENVTVSFAEAKLPSGAEIFALSPELPGMQQKLEIKKSDGRIEVRLRRIELYTMLVIRGGAQ